MNALRFPLCLAVLAIAAIVPAVATNNAQNNAQHTPQDDLDAFMQRVLARRDDNWKKLQQYVLDERERFELRGPAHTPLLREQRDYTWYILEGFFVRSPLKVNGADVPEADRRRYEAEHLARKAA